MSLYGYKPKTRPAPWTQLRPPAPAPEPRKPRRREKQPKAPWVLLRPEPAPPKPKRVRSVSKRKARGMAEYRRQAAAFVAAAVASGGTCPVVAMVPALRNGMRYGHKISARLNEVHHRRGRLGALLLDQRFWQALSKAGHRHVHENPQWARDNGFMVPKGLWNVPHRVGMCLGCGYRIDPSCEWCGECLCETEGND